LAGTEHAARQTIPQVSLSNNTNTSFAVSQSDLLASFRNSRPSSTASVSSERLFLLRQCARSQIRIHRNFEEPVRNALVLSLSLTQSDTSEFRIGKQTIGSSAAGNHALTAGDVGVHHAKIVDADMRKLWAAGDLADRPNRQRRFVPRKY
jgi:hypothetical protein